MKTMGASTARTGGYVRAEGDVLAASRACGCRRLIEFDAGLCRVDADGEELDAAADSRRCLRVLGRWT